MCSVEFKRKYPKSGKRKIYCSKKCRYSDTPQYEKICKSCGKTFTAIHLKKNKEYCSVSCVKRYPCQLCGTVITGRITFQSGEKKFCSRKCSNFVNRTLNSKLQYMPNGFAKSIKDHGKIKCDHCGIDDIQVLIVHHIDQNRKNNSIENLQTLCANCHHRIHWGTGEKRIKC
jgi:hypothetical protein